MTSFIKTAALLAALGLAGLTAGCEDQTIKTQQTGYRGAAMAQVTRAGVIAANKVKNALPEAIDPVDPSGTPSAKSSLYQNVQVLGDVDENEFIRLMTAMTAWVSPEQGCAYCHNVENMAEDKLYTKIVARKMLQMTRNINANWKSHVGATGVTCYTCHRGQPVPSYIWFQGPAGPSESPALGMLARYQGAETNSVMQAGAKSSLPSDPFTPLLEQANSIKVAARTALPTPTPGVSIQETGRTYSLMMHFASALGVNCTYCHNTEAFSSWELANPTKAVAWYGIRMVRQINTAYIDTVKSVWPANRLGPHGDGPKANCATCHQGVNKPLLGASMIGAWPELQTAGKQD